MFLSFIFHDHIFFRQYNKGDDIVLTQTGTNQLPILPKLKLRFLHYLDESILNNDDFCRFVKVN